MIEIRGATLKDIPDVARVHAQADWETYAPLFGAQAYALDVAACEQRWRRALDDGGVLLVAADQERIVGLGHAHADRIGALYLLASHRRQGIGKALLAQLLGALDERGIAEARFDVVAVNAAAIAFYRAQGAREVGRCVHSDARGSTEDLIFAIATAKADGCDRSRSSTG
jgi:ribosomal protein S18 acetylase RimI-like enzyme